MSKVKKRVWQQMGDRLGREVSHFVPVPDDAPRFNYPSVLSRGVGVEIEVENCADMDDFPHKLRVVVDKDNSLRGDNAYELITNHPMTCGEAVITVKDIFKWMDSKRKLHDLPRLFEFNERTSIHVHVDVRDLTWDQVLSVAQLYLIFEKSLFDFAGRNRFYNIFCVPLSECNLVDQGPDQHKVFKKYCAINLAAVRQKGTVEFRAMAGNDNTNAIVSWIYLLVSLVEFCAKCEPEIISNIITTLKWESQYAHLACDIWGEELYQLIQIFPESHDSNASLAKNLR